MKQRYEVLDGLRGVAALAVVCIHFLVTFFPDDRSSPLPHAGLAVDFFYMLSGFVVAHAYDARWTRMSVRQFFGLRLQRLHPLVVLGAVLGLATYVFDPFYPAQHQVGGATLAAVFLLGVLLLPAPSLPNRTDATHSLNGPSWSLTQEYLANIAYAAIGPRIGRNRLIALVAVSGAALALVGASQDTLQVGWSWQTLWMAPIRTAFPFFAGVLIQRLGIRLTAPGGWAMLSAVLAASFAAPWLPALGGAPLNGLFETALVVGLFPLLIAAGASAQAKGALGRLCRICGELSYPIYIVHYPIVTLFSHWVWTRHPSHLMIVAVGAPLALALPLAALAALKLYDEPVRAWLAGRAKAPPQTLAGVADGAPPAG
ncbi:MAG TPA: acyltransferase [Phenylobacterium sp.]|nr:acyltransferase [Phenylobacterium sp.]